MENEEVSQMADDVSGSDGGGGFGWGLLVGVALGVVAGVFLASGPGRGQVENLRARTIELTGSARRAASDPENPIGRAINDGISAARRRRQELERAARGGRQDGVQVGEEGPADA
jgi:hypothetical protein